MLFRSLIPLVFLLNIVVLSQNGGEALQIGIEPNPDLIPIQTLTNANVPDPENVLVVYRNQRNSSDTLSEYVANYYISKRNIPAKNKLGLDIPLTATYGQDTVILYNEGEDIRGNGNTGWMYVRDFIGSYIENYLNNTIINGAPLKDRIDYIVLIKGIPLKVRYLPYNSVTWKSRYRIHASVSALLSLINQPDGRSFLQLYNTYVTSQLNPLFGVDLTITMDYRFKSNHFVNSGGWYTQYLVSWLNGDTYTDVINMIDRQADPDFTGEKTWVIDADPNATYSVSSMQYAHQKLKQFGFNLNPDPFVVSQDWIVTDINQVMGYTSNGVHTLIPMPPTYILDTLQFSYANGANFNSWESFNGFSFGVTRAGQGLISDFIHMGGSGGAGNVYEPWTDGITRESYTFPSLDRKSVG